MERPILFNSDMVRAILEGRKTQTRRPVKPQPNDAWAKPPITITDGKWTSQNCVSDLKCPFGIPGDRLWVRETWAEIPIIPHPDLGNVIYKATDNEPTSSEFKWKPSIHMPRWASRMALEITDIRVEKIQKISFGDACEEGILSEHFYRKRELLSDKKPGVLDTFGGLWNSIYGKKNLGWRDNPWVWVVEFKRVT